MSTSNHNLES